MIIPARATRAVRLAVRSVEGTAAFWLRGVVCPLARCEGPPPVVHASGTVVLGRGVALRSMIARSEIGAHRGGRLEIGDRAFVNQGCSIVATLAITVGEDARIGDFVGIYDTDHHRLDRSSEVRRAAVDIGANVWLCRGVMVLPGSTVGAHSVISAGSVVRGPIPAGVLAAGSPAVVVRKLDVGPGWVRN